jgi:phosphomannomutase
MRWAPDAKTLQGRVVLDTGNGVGGLFLKPLAKRLSAARVDAIFTEIDGNFPNRPSNPGLPGALNVLKQEVKRTEAMFGAAFDGDADRLFLVDEKGTFVTGDQLLAAIAASILDDSAREFTAGKPVVFAATCSWLIIETIRRFGGTPYICRVGQETVKTAMQAVGAVFGGESSAHFNFPESYYQDSGLIALLAFWQYLHARAKKPVSEIIASLNPWPHSGEINLEIKSENFRTISEDAVARLTKRYLDRAKLQECYVFELDGVSVYFPWRAGAPTVDELFPKQSGNPTGERYRGVHATYQPDWWFNIRRSNNEPLIRVNVECKAGMDVTQPTVALIVELMTICRNDLNCPVAVKDWGAIGPQNIG